LLAGLVRINRKISTANIKSVRRIKWDFFIGLKEAEK